MTPAELAEKLSETNQHDSAMAEAAEKAREGEKKP